MSEQVDELTKKAFQCGWTAGFGQAAADQVRRFADVSELEWTDFVPEWIAVADNQDGKPWRLLQAKFHEGFIHGGLAGSGEVVVS
jgi:hypothetical protein